MVILDKLRIRNVFVKNGVAAEEAAEEFAEVLDESFTDAAADFVTADQHATSEERLRAAIADMERRAAERAARQAERDARQARDAAERDRQIRNEMLIIAGLIIATMAICAGIIIAVLA